MSIIYNVHKVIKLEIALRLPEELIEKADILALDRGNKIAEDITRS